MKNLFIGTSGYNYKEWKGDFYPETVKQKDWMIYYSKQFTSLEINATFYRNFAPHVYAKWYNTTDQNFTFTLKGPRTITHIKRLNDVDEELVVFFSANAQLKEKLSSVLWQFPGSFRNNEKNAANLSQFLKNLPPKYRQVIEFRDSSWFTKDIYDMLKDHNTGFVINDSNKFPTGTVVTADFAYIRFHGPKKLYASSYSRDELQIWSEQIYQWLQTKDVYCYFNNDMGGHAFRNARELGALVTDYRKVSHASRSPVL
jgi:uncharacterized protein YecE (DUF72 family)